MTSLKRPFVTPSLGDDTAVSINSAAYNSTDMEITLAVNNGSQLPDGQYRLFACDSLEDEAGNQLDGDGNDSAGTDFSLDFSVDQTAPEISVVGIDGDADATSGITVEPIHDLTLTFSEAMNDPAGDLESNDVTNPAHYALIGAGENGVLDTAVCETTQADDSAVTINSVTYNENNFMVTIAFNDGAALEDDIYRFALCGNNTLTDHAGNLLNNGESSFSFNFTVETSTSFEIFLPLVLK